LRQSILSLALVLVAFPAVSRCETPESPEFPETVSMRTDNLLDKIRGGWVGKAYGVTFGGPTEFKHQGKMIEGPLEFRPEALERLSSQDDMYVNMALLKAIQDHGLAATPEEFAKEFAHGGFLLWHANGQGRQNLLAGIPPWESGHPIHNPHADDIDFQIECDFIGLVSPGLPQSAQKICDRAGHLMNYGDGVYGGYFVTATYAAAFIDNDVRRIVDAGLNALPNESGYAEIIRDVIGWHEQHPDNWQTTWHLIEEKYNDDRCPWGVKSKFNIQARLNGAYIALGLLYGEGDIEKTTELSTRCGQDSDCNPSNAAGVLGTMLGFENIPKRITAALKPHMETDFAFVPLSIESASKECFRLAMENVRGNGGRVSDDTVEIRVQPFRADGPAEVSFPTLEPVDLFEVTDPRLRWTGNWELSAHRKSTMSLRRSSSAGDFLEVEFVGNAVYVQGDLRHDQGILEYLIDGKSLGIRDMYLPDKWKRADQSTAVWLTGLSDGKHTLQVRVTGRENPQADGVMVSLGKVVAYRGEVASLDD